MRTLFLISLSFCCSFFAFSQAPKIDSLWDKGKLNELIDIYRDQYALKPDDQENLYNLASVFALTDQHDSTFKYLDITLKDEVSVQTFGSPDFYFVMDDPRWDSLRNEMIIKVEKDYGAYENRELSIELWTMKLKDQAFYYQLDIAQTKTSKSAIWELKHKLNEENLRRLDEIIEEFGWPTISLVKGSAAQAAFLIVQHADLETQKRYLPLMREAADNGEANWSSLALLIDRIEMREGRPQIYGSQIRDNGNGNLFVYEIIEPEFVNERRKKVGLEPIEEYVKNWDIEWTIEQKSTSE